MSFFAYYMGAPPQVSFFAYYMEAPSGQFLRLLYGGPPQVSLFAYYIGGPLRTVSSLNIGGPLRSVSSHTIWEPPSDQFRRLLDIRYKMFISGIKRP